MERHTTNTGWLFVLFAFLAIGEPGTNTVELYASAPSGERLPCEDDVQVNCSAVVPQLCTDPLGQIACSKSCNLCQPTGTICHACKDLAHPADCHNTTVCEPGLKCFVERQMDVLTGAVKFEMGCSSTQVCQIFSSTVQIGRRQSNHITTCYKCCASNFCSLDLCSSADHCQSRPCQNGGVCSSHNDTYNCTCPATHEGLQCEKEVDYCQVNNPCKHNGICHTRNISYVCTCIAGWSGADCTEWDPCSTLHPCRNGGTCESGTIVGTFVCKCDASHTGSICDEVNICSLFPFNPCSNGTCITNGDAYTCECFPGFTGPRCDDAVTQLSPSTTTTLQHTKLTTALKTEPVSTPFTSLQTSTKAATSITFSDKPTARSTTSTVHTTAFGNDTCNNDLCYNGGGCLVLTYLPNKPEVCVCLPGYTGSYCETPENLFSTIPTKTTGWLHPLTSTTHASWPSTLRPNSPCPVAPCYNGGTCLSGHGFLIDTQGRCACRPEFTGLYCQAHVLHPAVTTHAPVITTSRRSGPCPGWPCSNGGVCIATTTHPRGTCQCPPTYTGPYCQTHMCPNNVNIRSLGCGGNQDIVILIGAGKYMVTDEIRHVVNFILRLTADPHILNDQNTTKIAVGFYHTTATTVVKLTSDKNLINRQLSGTHASMASYVPPTGSNSLKAGLEHAYAMLSPNEGGRPDARKVVLVILDEMMETMTSLTPIARQLKQDCISLNIAAFDPTSTHMRTSVIEDVLRQFGTSGDHFLHLRSAVSLDTATDENIFRLSCRIV